jgi:WD40 repeat protein
MAAAGLRPDRPEEGSVEQALAAAAAAESSSTVVHPRHVLSGHGDEVTCVAVHGELDIVVSASLDGLVLMHTVRAGAFLRRLNAPCNGDGSSSGEGDGDGSGCARVSLISISPEGRIVTFSSVDLTLRLYTLNGRPLAAVETYERLNVLRPTGDSRFLITGGEGRALVVRSLEHGLQMVHKYARDTERTERPITALAVAKDQRHVLVGAEDGKLTFFSVFGGNAPA